MYQYTRSYEGLGRQAYTRSQGGLGWLSSPGMTDMFPGGRNICFRPDEENFASSRGCRPKYGMGCRKPDGTVSRYPCCPSDQTKTLWECPSGWETTIPAASTATASSDQVRQLQQTMLNAGCQLPQYGADGRWGSETMAALQCYAGQVGWASISRDFPWAASRMGQTLPGGGGAVATPSDGGEATPDVFRAGVLPFAMPGIFGEWWFWIAVAGIGGLGIAGYLQYKKNKETDEFGEIGGF